MNIMLVRCERDGTMFNVTPSGYPTNEKRMKEYTDDGDMCIDCPRCARRYFYIGNVEKVKDDPYMGSGRAKKGEWWSDRKLTVIKELIIT